MYQDVYKQLDESFHPSMADLLWFYQNGWFLSRLEWLDVQRHLEHRRGRK
jgi:hypothetical protein